MKSDGRRAEERDGAAPCRVLVADDHPLLRSMLRTVLGGEPGLEVVGEAENGREAVGMCLALEPDLVLMDVSMPVMDGITATRKIKAERPRTIVLVVSAHESPEYLMEAVMAGAAGYVIKDATPERLLNAVRRALEGESPLNQELAMRLLRRLSERERANGRIPSDAPPTVTEAASLVGSPVSRLTVRELEVLGALAVGKTNRQIAAELSISRATVKTHVERLIAKLGVSDRTQAAVMAVKLGLFVEREWRRNDAARPAKIRHLADAPVDPPSP